MESPKSADTKGLQVTCTDYHVAVIIKWGTLGHSCVFCQSIQAELKTLVLSLNHQSVNLDNLEPPGSSNTLSEMFHSTHSAHQGRVGSDHPGGVDQVREDSDHPGGVDQGREDSAHPGGVDRMKAACKSCLDIKAEIDTFICSERTGSRDSNAFKMVGSQELGGFRLGKETFLPIKEEAFEERFCIKDSSKSVTAIQSDKSQPPTLSPLVKSVGLALPLDVPDIDSTVPTETQHSQQLEPGVTTCITLSDRGMECVQNEPEGNLSQKVKTVKRNDVLGNMTHTVLKPHACKVCNMRFITRNQLKTHHLNHTGEKPYKCDQCGKAFAVKGRLTKHEKLHTGEKPFICDLCGKGFAVKCTLTQHKKVHAGEKPFICGYCGKGFASEFHLSCHNTTHTGEKPYNCDICGKAFAWKENFVVHIQTHTGEKPFKCDVCGRRFGSKGELLPHTRTHTVEKPYACDICGRAFARQQHLIAHNRTHTGNKKTMYVAHNRTHTGNKKPRSVEVLNMALKWDLIKHTRPNTGEKPYRCDVCGTDFIQKKHLVVHSWTHTEGGSI